MGYHVRVKICGVTRVADVEAAAAAGADAVGLNFHPPSPRSITAQRAGELLSRLPPFVAAVGVFVRKKLAEASTFLAELERVRVVQVHGGEPEIAAFPWHHVPAFQVQGAADLYAVRRYLDACREAGCLPSAVLIDGHAPGLTGGTGVTAPWDLLADFHPGVPVLLAGGLTPENVALAVRRVRPWGVDVASGVELSPGVKDADKVRRFIERAREAAAGIEEGGV